ncbi:MAG: GNAT family N-acetyltransferase [Alphaproteobacteria bacterium]|nr:GNAT family N-acetyltransferase [Alphaproteobacteria bacterium]
MTETSRPSRHIAVRDAAEADIAAVQRIYAPYVMQALATFEEEPPSAAELSARRAAVLERGLPYLVAECDGVVAGYSYATPFRPRPAYRFAVENSVYVDERLHGCGIGRVLLEALIARCAAGPWRQMIAVIGDSGNAASIGLHARMGFRHIGTLSNIGFKFGRWVDAVLMQRELGT